MINYLPIVVAVLYFITSISFLIKKDYAWFLVWFSYSIGNIGLTLVSNK